MKLYMLTKEEVELRQQDYIDFYGLSTYTDPRRCRVCGRYKKEHCSLEVPVQGGWLWEHL